MYYLETPLAKMDKILRNLLTEFVYKITLLTLLKLSFKQVYCNTVGLEYMFLTSLKKSKSPFSI